MAPADLFDVDIYVRRYRLIAATVMVLLLLGAVGALLKPSYYSAKVTLLVGSRLGQSGPIAAEGERRAYAIKLLQLTARKARLQAEIAGATEIAFPVELTRATENPFAGAIMDGERQLLLARQRTLQESMEKFRMEKSLAEQRIDALTKQVRLSDVQQRSIDKEVEDLKGLVDRKLAASPRLSDMQRTAAAFASHKIEIESEIMRTEQGKNQADQRITEFRNQRRSDSLAELQTTDADLRDLVSRRETLRAVAASTLGDQKLDPGLLANQTEILTSDDLVRKVVQQLKLDGDSSFIGGAAGEDQATCLRAAITEVQANLLAVRVGSGSRIDLTYRSKSPKRAAEIANQTAAVYVDEQSATTLRGSEDAILPAGDEHQALGAVVLRAAETPRRQDGPGFTGITLAAAVLGLVFGLVLAAGAEFVDRMRTANPRLRPSGVFAGARRP